MDVLVRPFELTWSRLGGVPAEIIVSAAQAIHCI